LGPVTAYRVLVYQGGGPEFFFGEQEYSRNTVPISLPSSYSEPRGTLPLMPLLNIAYAGHFLAEWPDALITWHEGGLWTMQIHGGGNVEANLKTAQTVARAIQQHHVTLPSIQEPGTAGTGTLVIQNLGGGSFRTSIYWDIQLDPNTDDRIFSIEKTP
jgi:hypothetical protein